MPLTLLLPAEIASDWEHLCPLLRPAIAHDEQRQESDVYRDLMAGDMALFHVAFGDMRGVAVIEFRDGVCWLLYVAGRLGGWERARMVLEAFELVAKAHGCTEIRVEGRDWSRLLRDYERLGGHRNELRKRL